MGSPFPVELLQNIFVNLGKYDLLNCRLVSKDWNEESVQILQKSKYRQRIFREIGDFVKFSEQCPKFILPFHLGLYDDNNSNSITKITSVSTQVENLTRIFGQECILNLTAIISFKRDHQSQIQALIVLLGQLSRELQTLTLTTFSEIGNVSSVENEVDAVKEFVFPKMERVFLNILNSSADVHMPLWFALIEKSQNLQELEILGSQWTRAPNVSNLNAWTKLFAQIKSLKVINFPTQWILQIIRQPSFTTRALKTLELSTKLTRENMPETEFYEILRAFAGSGSIESLRIFFYCYTSGIRVSMSFPFLPKLKDLGIIFDKTGRIDPIEFQFDYTSFPKLESIQISPFVQLCTNGATFSQVNFLTIRVSEDVMNSNITRKLKPYQENLEKLQKIFPAVTKFCLKDVRDNSNDNEGTLKYILNGIIRSTGAEKVTEITLVDIDHNFLGDILHFVQNPPKLVLENLMGNSNARQSFQILTGCLESEIMEAKEDGQDGQYRTIIQGKPSLNLTNKLKNVQKFGLLRSKKSIDTDWQIYSENGIPERNIHVEKLLKNLPLLKEMDISGFYFGTATGRRKKLIQELFAKYPDSGINVT